MGLQKDCLLFSKWNSTAMNISTRHKFWIDKFHANRARHEKAVKPRLDSVWRVLTVWECAPRSKTAQPSTVVVEAVKAWLDSSDRIGEIQVKRARVLAVSILSLSDHKQCAGLQSAYMVTDGQQPRTT